MKNHYLTLAMLGALALSTANCTDDNTLNGQSPDNQVNADGIYATMTLTAKGFGSFVQSRADNDWTPSKEAPVLKEGEIQDVLIFIYSTSFNDASLTVTEKPVVVKYLVVTETGTNTGIYSIPRFRLPDNMAAGEYKVFVVANPDYRPEGANYNEDYFRDKTVMDIRDAVYSGDLYRDRNGGDISMFDRFIMSSDVERSFTLTQSIIDSKGTVSLSYDATTEEDKPIVVERLAARIDISFGPSIVYDNNHYITTNGSEYRSTTGQVTLTNGTPDGEVATIELPVYDYTAYQAGELIPTYDRLVISDVKVLNIVNNKQLLVQKNGNVYFQDERWGTKEGKQKVNGVDVYYDGYYAQNSTSQASGCHKEDKSYPLKDLILKRNNLYTDKNGVPFYTLGYYRENINNKSSYKTDADITDDFAGIKEGKTTVKLTGTYKKASDLPSVGANYDVVLEFPIMHCHLNPTENHPVPYPRAVNAMSYAIGRNTIYRLRIDKVLCDGEKVYVRWYYDCVSSGDNHVNDGEFEIYNAATPFGSWIVDSNAVPND